MGQTAPYYHQRERASSLAKSLVRVPAYAKDDKVVCRVLLPGSGEVQHEVRDVRLQRQGEPRRRQHAASRLRIEGVDSGRRDKDRRDREESGELRTRLTTGPFLDGIVFREKSFPNLT